MRPGSERWRRACRRPAARRIRASGRRVPGRLVVSRNTSQRIAAYMYTLSHPEAASRASWYSRPSAARPVVTPRMMARKFTVTTAAYTASCGPTAPCERKLSDRLSVYPRKDART